MRINGLTAQGVEVMGDVEIKFKSNKIKDDKTGKEEWVKTSEQIERDGLFAWVVRVLVQTGSDARVREPITLSVFSPAKPKLVDGDIVRFEELDVRAYDGRLNFTALELRVVRDDKWVAA